MTMKAIVRVSMDRVAIAYSCHTCQWACLGLEGDIKSKFQQRKETYRKWHL